MRVFVDSDVIISSLLSESGAAYLLINKNYKDLNLFVSNLSCQELKIVAKRLKIKKKKLENLVKKRFKTVRLKESGEGLKTKYGRYTTDPDDSHIVAGAKKARAKFLLTYNHKHFKTNKIKKDFDFILLTPSNFLQYLRSQ